MKVFKVCLLIIKRHITAFVLYFVIFMALSVIMPMLSAEQYGTDFSEMKPNFTIINRDGDTPLSDGLAAYLGRLGNEVVLDDRKDALQDASFYHATDFIAILPRGFHNAFWEGSPVKIETVVTTDSAKGYYVDILVNQYLNQARMYQAAGGMGEAAVVSAVLSDLSAETRVEIKRFGAGAPIDEVFQIFSRMICYIITVLVILCVSNILSAFRRPDLRMRNLCAPAKPRSVSGQQMLCGVLVSIAAWLLLTALGFVIYGSKLAGSDWRIVGLILLNSFTATLVALSVASLAGPFIKGLASQNAIANFTSLVLSFLGGVFVPLEMMGEGLIAVARFTPTYWYVTALDHICALNSLDGGVLAPVWQAMLTQLIFAAAFLCLALAIIKHMNQSERSFGSIRTELDA
ncbi:MAG: ABC transporter permease [Oscillospiraceae bacterium]|nr:ABC transporter permease [Oscillospiraceae bacterium]